MTVRTSSQARKYVLITAQRKKAANTPSPAGAEFSLPSGFATEAAGSFPTDFAIGAEASSAAAFAFGVAGLFFPFGVGSGFLSTFFAEG